MAKTISISHKSPLGPKQKRAALDNVFLSLQDKYGVEGEWKSDKLFVLSGDGFEGNVLLSDNGTVTISLSLGLALSMFSSIIETEIRSQLTKQLG